MGLYKQLKISVDKSLAESFKAVCAKAGISMAAEISEFMAVKTNTILESADKAAPSYDTRRKRRRCIGSIIPLIESIRQHEEAYLARIPSNLQSGQAYENSEQTIDNLDQAIDLLKEAY